MTDDAPRSQTVSTQTLHAIVGDVHGELDSLLSLEERVHSFAEQHGFAATHFVLVGDLVDRGPNSAGVVEHARKGVAAGTHSVILGNHEEAMLAALDAHAPELLIEAGTALPRNIEGIDFQWDAGRRQGEQSFEVEMRTEDVTVRWYT